MGKVFIVTDSTCDLPKEVLEQTGITTVPLKIRFGEETYLDQVNLTSQRFFEMLGSCTSVPRTSQPSPGEFAEVYKSLREGGAEGIVSVHLSSKLSGTYQSAYMARSMLPELNIEVVDGGSASLGTGLLALEAVAMAAAGASAAGIAERLQVLAKRLHVFFAVDTLEYLAKNGRIGRAQALLGTLLSVKPILTLEDGEVGPYDKVRGRSKVIPRVVEAIMERIPPGNPVRLAVAHGNCPQEAEELKKAVCSHYQVDQVLTGWVGPAIGCNVGPGVLAALALDLGGL